MGHRAALDAYGVSPYHRTSWRLFGVREDMDLDELAGEQADDTRGGYDGEVVAGA